MAGAVRTVAGNGAAGFADGAGAAARFNSSSAFVVDGEGVIVVADRGNHRLRKILDGQVTTLAGSSEPVKADVAGAVSRLNEPFLLALDERGRLLVIEAAGGEGRKDTLRVVEASLQPLCMGPVERAAEDSEARMPVKTQAKLATLENYGKLLEDGTLADVVLLVEGERFPAHREMLVVRSEYLSVLFLSGMQGGSSEGGVHKIKQVSAGAFRVVKRR